MKLLLVGLLITLTASCGRDKKKEKSVSLPTKAEELKNLYLEKLSFAKTLEDPADGWIEKSECDGMLWAAKYACGGGSPNILAAEYPNKPGKFNRRPAPYCGAEFNNAQTTWSRDMGMGLISYAWCKKDLSVLERHASYGKSENWVMGEPFADGRVVYTPSIIGILYQSILSLGGKDSPARVWPSIYSSGLDDYQAHLQMIDIWLRSEMEKREIDLSLDISKTMWERVKEHSDREPNCSFYQYMRGIYEGSVEKATDTLVTYAVPQCQYLRGGNEPLAEWLFAARLTLKKVGLVE